MNELANHLWQSTAFAAAIGLAALALRRNSARVRYWLWLAASLKFLVPFSLLVSIGARVEVPAAARALPANTAGQISTYFAPAPTLLTTVADVDTVSHWPMVLGAAWLAGALCLLLRWLRRWRMIRRAARSATVLSLGQAVPVLSSPLLMEPGVFGVLRPVLLLPEGITEKLT